MENDEKNKTVSLGDDYDETLLQTEEELRGGNRKDGPYMVIVQGPHQGFRFVLNEGDNIIGRVMGSEILLEDQSVSRRHAAITQSREGFIVEDFGSKNGTFVNGQKIAEKVTIGHGDVVQVGIYSLRLITKPVTKEEEIKTIPADWESRTIMTGASKPSKPEEPTNTMMEKADSTSDVELPESSENAGGDSGGKVIVEEIEETPEKKARPLWWNIVMIGTLAVFVLGGGVYGYYKFFHKASKGKSEKELVQKPEELLPAEGTEAPAGAPTGTPPPPMPAVEPPKAVPVFLDFASSPLPANVSFGGRAYGVTPLKIQETLDVGKQYTAEGIFELKEIGESYKASASFVVDRDQTLVPVFFKGPIGVLKVMELPRDVDLYLEGYFIYNPFSAKTAKLADVIFGKPIYVPYGKYVIELRQDKEIAGSGEYVKDIRYRREALVTEDNPVLVITITEQDLKEFPVEVISVPENADVLIDGKKVGNTPYKGIFPLGEHALAVRKDGFLEHSQEMNMEQNVPVKLEVVLKTTAAGEFIVTGKHLMEKGLYKDAMDKLTEVFKNNASAGEIAQTRYLIGSCFVHLGDLATAEGYFRQAMEDPAMKHASMLGLISVFHGLGRKDEAVPYLVDVMLNSDDKIIRQEANALFQQISPLRSIIYVHTKPDGAKVFVNGNMIAQETPLILPDLSLGNYKIRIEKDGFIPQDLSVNMSVSEFNPIVVELKPVAK